MEPVRPETRDPARAAAADLRLVRRALSRDEAAVDAVLERCGCVPRFVRRLDHLLGTRLGVDQLEDVVQQVYIAVWPRLREFAGNSTLETWLYGFCRNCLRAEARKSGHRRRVVGPLPDLTAEGLAADAPLPETQLLDAERIERVRAELERLEPAEREAVVMRHLEGWSFEDIARRQGLSASTIKDRCYRAMQRMKVRLRDSDDCS